MKSAPRVKRETIKTGKFDLITVTLLDPTGQKLAVLEFDRLADKTPKIIFVAQGLTAICDG